MIVSCQASTLAQELEKTFPQRVCGRAETNLELKRVGKGYILCKKTDKLVERKAASPLAKPKGLPGGRFIFTLQKCHDTLKVKPGFWAFLFSVEVQFGVYLLTAGIVSDSPRPVQKDGAVLLLLCKGFKSQVSYQGFMKGARCLLSLGGSCESGEMEARSV